MGRKYARESAMKLLYQMEINSDFTENATEIFFLTILLLIMVKSCILKMLREQLLKT